MINISLSKTIILMCVFINSPKLNNIYRHWFLCSWSVQPVDLVYVSNDRWLYHYELWTRTRKYLSKNDTHWIIYVRDFV